VKPDWRYAAEAAERGLAVVRLRAAGTQRSTATRLRLFLRGYDVAPGRIKRDLCAEFLRLQKRHVFRRPWEFEAGGDVRDAENEQLFGLSDEASPTYVANDLRNSKPAAFGAGATFILGVPVWESILPILISTLDEIPILTDKIKKGLVRDIEPYFEVLGLFGNPVEVERNCLRDIQNCSTADIHLGREFYRAVVSLADVAAHLIKLSNSEIAPAMAPAFERVVESIRDSDEWCTTIFAAGAVAALRGKQSDTRLDIRAAESQDFGEGSEGAVRTLISAK
jgi:hypothetical protein